jgi:hypothetical protein
MRWILRAIVARYSRVLLSIYFPKRFADQESLNAFSIGSPQMSPSVRDARQRTVFPKRSLSNVGPSMFRPLILSSGPVRPQAAQAVLASFTSLFDSSVPLDQFP